MSALECGLKLAKAATQGKWKAHPSTDRNAVQYFTKLGAHLYPYEYEKARADADFVTWASPSQVIALISQIKDLETDLNFARKLWESKQWATNLKSATRLDLGSIRRAYLK